MIDNTKPLQLLQNIDLNDTTTVGKSVCILAKFSQEKLPIPTGFVVSIYGFNQYLDLTDLRSYYKNSLKERDRSDLIHAFESSNLPGQLQNEIITFYSKLSGFTDAYVNLKGLILDEESNELRHRSYSSYDIRGEQYLVKAIENLYKEIVLDNANAIDKFFNGKLKIVILVQKSLQSEASGLLQTSDIITKDNTKLIIEALYGLESGAALEGLVPDQYIFDKNTNSVKEKHISLQEFMIVRQPGSANSTQKVTISPAWQKRQKLDDKHILVLAKTGLIVEEELNEPQIISWVYESGKLWITFVESAFKKEAMEENKQTLQKKVEETFETEKTGTDLNVHIPEEVAKNKSVLVDLILKDAEDKEDKSSQNEMDNTKENQNKKFHKEPLLEGAFGAGNEAQGEVSFESDNSNINNILVLKGDEDISSTLKVAGFIVEDESQILAERLYEYFKVPVITGVPLARKILKKGEKITINGESTHIYELVPYTEQLGEVEMSFTSNADHKTSKSNFSFPVQANKTIEVQTQLSPKFLNDDEADIEVIENNEIEINKNQTIEVVQDDVEPVKEEVLSSLKDGKATLYEDQKVRIERKDSNNLAPIPPKPLVPTNQNISDISKLLDLVNEDANEEVAEVINEKAQSSKEEITGLNQQDQFKVWGNSLEKIISSSKNVPTATALEALEHVIDDSKESIHESKEYTFDQEEQYISHVNEDLVPEKPSKRKDTFIPTATKVYAQVIDESLDEDLENYDGVVFTSTYEPEVLMQYLDKVLQKSNEKEVLVIAPPYEEEALEKFFKLIYNQRNKGHRNISLILPDYRNKKEIAEYKKILSTTGLRRSSTFEIFANMSRTINVFRVEELDEEIVDGAYVDLFRLKMNMLGVEKLTASTKYVEGMKNLVSYVHENLKLEGRALVNISGFENYKKVLEHISNFKFWGIICEQGQASEVKTHISKIEQKALSKTSNLLSSTKRRRK